MSAYTQIRVENRDDVAIVAFDRPDRLNAWTRHMGRELNEAVTAANDDPAIGAIVITGTGRGFCAGADMADEFQDQIDGKIQRTTDPDARVFNWVDLVRTSKPMVAAVNGPAIGMGLSMILSMDRIVAARSARLSARFIKAGVIPELASSRFLPQRVGFGTASDLMLSGRIVDAEEALSLGLVDELVDDDQLIDAAIARARSYGENAPPHLLWIKELLTVNAGEHDTDLVQRREHEALSKAFATAEHREAIDAFMNKRAPDFRNL